MGEINTREQQYMIGRKAMSALAPLSAGGPNGNGADVFDTDTLVRTLSAIPDVSVVRVVKRSGLAVLSAEPAAPHGDIVVVRTSDPDRAEYLEALAQRNPSLILERDRLLQHLGSFRPQLQGLPRNPSQITTASIEVRFHVQDPNGQPVPDADIVVYGDSGTEDQDKTDSKGDVSITIMGGSLNHVIAVYIKPAADFWERFIERPALDQHAVNTVSVRPLGEFSAAHFPGSPFLGWGQRLMGLLDLDLRQATGAGARVAIIDSGCDNTHPALRHITLGRDYTNLNSRHEPDLQTWTDDVISHGTHCAGIIAGNGAEGHILGFAPAAEVHILKVFPGGAFNNLVAAINYCIDNEIHVVNCSLGSDVGSQLVAQSIDRARQAGVALFVAAGNSAGAVQFPANVPGVLCVSALGQVGNVPDYTYHARTVPDGATVVTGQVYPARFNCHGPQVAACAPGVGIISSVPGGGYAAWDGTSMADPHLTGLGALLAAHHPELCKVKVRDAGWVDRLMGLLVSAAQSTGVDPQYGGAGLPIASRALGGKFAAQSAWPYQTPQQFPPDVIEELAKAVLKLLPRDRTASPDQPYGGSESSSRAATH